MLKISWKEIKTNEEVLKMADKQLYIIPTIKKIKITYLGHMMRRNNIHSLILEGQPEGKITRGRPIIIVDDKYQRMDGKQVPI